MRDGSIMALRRIWIQNYRTLRDVEIDLGRLTVVVGANGVGKSNLYRSLMLMQRAIQGGLGRAIAEEGGLASAVWAGMEKGFSLSFGLRIEDFSYELTMRPRGPVSFGQEPDPFDLDPVISEEKLWHGEKRRPGTTFLERVTNVAKLRGTLDQQLAVIPQLLTPNETALSQIPEPENFALFTFLAREARSWRFYHEFNTASDSPIRRPCVATFTNVLDHDGANLGAALLTILKIGERARLADLISRALGGKLHLSTKSGLVEVGLEAPGLHRPLTARELSDGTLRFLCLTAALFSPRPPSLMVLNEPETSLHPDVLPILGQLIREAADACPIWMTTHSKVLANEVAKRPDCRRYQLKLVGGETKLED